MLALTKQKATLEHINVRTERHGDRPTGAVDLKFAFIESSDLLIEAHPSLQSFLFKPEKTPQQDMDEVEQVPTVRRFGDLIQGLSLKCPIKGADVLIGFGLGGPSDIDLETADVKNHHVAIMEGGSCRYQLMVKATPTSEQVKKLFEVLGGEVDLTIIPAEGQAGNAVGRGRGIMKIAPREKVGFVGACMASPQSYESQLSQWSKPSSDRVAKHALDQLEAARRKDVAAHERNLAQIEVHKAIHARVNALMEEIRIPNSWSQRDTKSRSRYPRSFSVPAGYLADLLREAPITDGFESATYTYESLKTRYQQYAEQADREAKAAREKAERAAEVEKAERRANIEMAAIILRYGLDIDSTWDEILEALRGRDKYLDLAIAGEDTRGDWSDGPYRVEDALYAIVEDQQLATDARLASSKSREC